MPSSLKLWITDSETIFNAYLLISSGRVQCVIENLGEEDIDENDDSSDEEEEEKEEDDDDDDKFPSLEKIISKLENFYKLLGNEDLKNEKINEKTLMLDIDHSYISKPNEVAKEEDLAMVDASVDEVPGKLLVESCSDLSIVTKHLCKLLTESEFKEKAKINNQYYDEEKVEKQIIKILKETIDFVATSTEELTPSKLPPYRICIKANAKSVKLRSHRITKLKPDNLIKRTYQTTLFAQRGHLPVVNDMTENDSYSVLYIDEFFDSIFPLFSRATLYPIIAIVKPLPLYTFGFYPSRYTFGFYPIKIYFWFLPYQDILLVPTLSRYTFGFYPSRYTFGFYLSLISRYTLVSTFQVLPLVTTLNSYFRLLYFYIIQFFTIYSLGFPITPGLNSTI
ncbi:hypothetical protein H8356DRAFT_1373654 [Neocallimastix lanati (nom. inval.)]|nr:hypothetical protein H8356DRAFT_1373654 [Neocallimastix sp. JGI-2020a]